MVRTSAKRWFLITAALAVCPALSAPAAVGIECDESGVTKLEIPVYDSPKETWKSIRTTNTIENLNLEFRRRTKTQASILCRGMTAAAGGHRFFRS
jgi:hypothetical protein